jgi:hypothetical protein
MRGDLVAAGVRSRPAAPRERWSSWISALLRRRHHSTQERLEVTERLLADERRSRRAGEYVPEAGTARRWC